MMNRRLTTFGASVLLCGLLLAGAVLAAPDAHSVDRWVIGGGGGRLGDFPLSLQGTIGQPAVGIVTSGPNDVNDVGSGFWFEVGGRAYLPLVVRE
jgi:hypothetical protein